MNVLSDPALFTNLQGGLPAMVGQGFIFTPNGSPQALIYVGAPFKLPTSLTFQVTATTGSTMPTLTGTVIGPFGQTVTNYPVTANTVTSRTLTIPGNATSFRLDYSDGVGAGKITLTVDPVSAIDRIYPPSNLGRSTKAYVSGYERGRIHQSVMFANEVRPLVADFTGAVEKGRVIAEATWDTWQGYSAFMSLPTLTDTVAGITLGFQYPGRGSIRCTATLDNGEKLVQQFAIRVKSAPYYQGDYYLTGPSRVTITA